MVDIEKMRGQAEQLKGRIEQTVGRATGSMETQARGKVDEAKGQVREKVADVKGTVNRQAGEVQKDVSEAADKAKAAISKLNRTTVALSAAAVVILIALIGALIRGRLAVAELSVLQRQGQAMIDLGKVEATKAKATAERFESKLAGNLEGMAGQLRQHPASRRVNGLTGIIATSVVLGGIVTAILDALASGRRAA
jgi:uncharacterized protein YjbJ (UPF0337 family)